MVSAALKVLLYFFFFAVAAITGLYTLSLHDALPILAWSPGLSAAATALVTRTAPIGSPPASGFARVRMSGTTPVCSRSEEHTSELQSLRHLVCRLLLEKKKRKSKGVRM